ncbi:MAG: RnfABCDGE type electron transport complex subunit D, partial [Patescibacteria group bacterium]
MGFHQQLRFPKFQLTLILLLLVFSTLLNFSVFTVTRIIILSVLYTIGLDLLFNYFRKQTVYTPYAALVTGLIFGLTIHPYLPWYGIFLISLIAMGTKHFLRFSNRHIFNPAAIGLVFGNIFLLSTVSWWGVSFQVLQLSWYNFFVFFILLLPLYVSCIRMKRCGSVCAFLFVYAALRFFLHTVSPITSLVDPTVLFFALVMLPEPMTSPVKKFRQILYGAFVAIASFVYFYLPF